MPMPLGWRHDGHDSYIGYRAFIEPPLHLRPSAAPATRYAMRFHNMSSEYRTINVLRAIFSAILALILMIALKDFRSDDKSN